MNRNLAMESSPKMSGLVCSGFCVGSVYVPAFQIGRGEIAKLMFPRDLATEMDRVAIAFCGEHCDGVRAEGQVVAPEFPMARSRLLEMIHRQTATEWLATRTGMTQPEARNQLKRVHVSPNAPLSTLAGTPRWLIGFLAAVHERPAGIIFDAAGLDPIGIQSVLATSNERLADAAGVYLTCFPNVGIREPEFAAVLEVTSRKPQPVT